MSSTHISAIRAEARKAIDWQERALISEARKQLILKRALAAEIQHRHNIRVFANEEEVRGSVAGKGLSRRTSRRYAKRRGNTFSSLRKIFEN